MWNCISKCKIWRRESQLWASNMNGENCHGNKVNKSTVKIDNRSTFVKFTLPKVCYHTHNIIYVDHYYYYFREEQNHILFAWANARQAKPRCESTATPSTRATSATTELASQTCNAWQRAASATRRRQACRSTRSPSRTIGPRSSRSTRTRNDSRTPTDSSRRVAPQTGPGDGARDTACQQSVPDRCWSDPVCVCDANSNQRTIVGKHKEVLRFARSQHEPTHSQYPDARTIGRDTEPPSQFANRWRRWIVRKTSNSCAIVVVFFCSQSIANAHLHTTSQKLTILSLKRALDRDSICRVVWNQFERGNNCPYADHNVSSVTPNAPIQCLLLRSPLQYGEPLVR